MSSRELAGRYIILWLVMPCALTLLPAAAAPVEDVEHVLDMSAGALVTVKINDHPLRLRVDFDAPANAILLNRAAAMRAGLRDSVPASPPCTATKIVTRTIFHPVTIGTMTKKIHIAWSGRNIVDGGADGLIGPTQLPENRVTLKLRSPVAGERVMEFPAYFGSRSDEFLSNFMTLGGRTVRLKYAPHQPFSLATASAGAHLAAMQDGHWAGEPRSARVRAWMDRPVRPMTLNRSLSLSGLPLRGFLVRTTDFRGDFQLPPDAPVDPDEIVVTGKTTGRCPASLELILGRDSLGGCSSISHDKRREILTLRCL